MPRKRGDDIAHPLLVFVNPPEYRPSPSALGTKLIIAPRTGPVPRPSDAQAVIYFRPGLCDLGKTPYPLSLTQGLYLAGGAYVRGTIRIAPKARGVRIAGPGILSGLEILDGGCRAQGPSTCPIMIDGSKAGGNIGLQDVTIVNAPFYNIRLDGDGNTVSNIKVISWLPNTDGVTAAGGAATRGSRIEDSFFKTGDDAIKLYTSKLRVSRCTLWQLDNAAPFEMGVNLKDPVSDVTVSDSDVIRTEWTFANRSNALVSAAFGGDATGQNYLFQNIRVENSPFRISSTKEGTTLSQLLKIAVIPNADTHDKNNSLGSITGLTFADIAVSDAQTLSDLFQSFDWQHRVTDVTFRNVTVADQIQPPPRLSFNANRSFSLDGTVFSGVLLRKLAQPTEFQSVKFSAAGPANPPYPVLTNSALGATFQVLGIGDFAGQGTAWVLLLNRETKALALWDGGDQAPSTIGRIEGGYAFAGIGDFNGDGCPDILLWNAQTGEAQVWPMHGVSVQPPFSGQLGPLSSQWAVVGISDINQAGSADILLRDGRGDVRVVALQGTRFVDLAKLAAHQFFYPKADGTTGTFDRNWTVAGVGDFHGGGYAGILWVNPSTGQVGATTFRFQYPPAVVLPRLPIQACGL
jgi:hypothetical protein